MEVLIERGGPKPFKKSALKDDRRERLQVFSRVYRFIL
jgi:hypothetical protein